MAQATFVGIAANDRRQFSVFLTRYLDVELYRMRSVSPVRLLVIEAFASLREASARMDELEKLSRKQLRQFVESLNPKGTDLFPEPVTPAGTTPLPMYPYVSLIGTLKGYEGLNQRIDLTGHYLDNAQILKILRSKAVLDQQRRLMFVSADFGDFPEDFPDSGSIGALLATGPRPLIGSAANPLPVEPDFLDHIGP